MDRIDFYITLLLNAIILKSSFQNASFICLLHLHCSQQLFQRAVIAAALNTAQGSSAQKLHLLLALPGSGSSNRRERHIICSLLKCDNKQKTFIRIHFIF